MPRICMLNGIWDRTLIRGATELTTTTPSGEKISSGLDKDYAFAWSYGKGELLTLLVPNAYGGSSGGMLGPNSELYKELRAKGAQVGKKRYRLLPIGERRHLLPGRFISGHWSASCLFWECS